MDALLSGQGERLDRPATAPGRAVDQINGVNINAGDLRELMTPRLMYLWRGRVKSGE